jgi:hypothetical protein
MVLKPLTPRNSQINLDQRLESRLEAGVESRLDSSIVESVESGLEAGVESSVSVESSPSVESVDRSPSGESLEDLDDIWTSFQLNVSIPSPVPRTGSSDSSICSPDVSFPQITDNPTDSNTETIFVPRARLERLEYINANLSFIIQEALKTHGITVSSNPPE